MQAIPSVIPLSLTASITSSVMSRTASPPAVRSSVSRWKTFTAPSTLLGPTCHDPPILRVRAAYVTREPSVPGSLVPAGGRHAVVGGRRRGSGSGGNSAACSPADGDRSLHASLPVTVDRAVHLVLAPCCEGELHALLFAWLDVPGLHLVPAPGRLDLQAMGGLAVVRDLERIPAGLRDRDRARAERVLHLRDLDRLEDAVVARCSAFLVRAVRGAAGAAVAAATAGGQGKGQGDEKKKIAHARSTRLSAVRIPLYGLRNGPVAQLVRA